LTETAATQTYTLSLHDALPIYRNQLLGARRRAPRIEAWYGRAQGGRSGRGLHGFLHRSRLQMLQHRTRCALHGIGRVATIFRTLGRSDRSVRRTELLRQIGRASCRERMEITVVAG